MKVIFACVHNAGRSQMAASLFNHLACGSEDLYALSAGTQPAERVHPVVVEVMNELGIDLSRVEPRLLSESLAKDADLLVTMGCGEACPFVPGLRRIDWPLQDPKGQSHGTVRAIRDEIKERVVLLLSDISAQKQEE